MPFIYDCMGGQKLANGGSCPHEKYIKRDCQVGARGQVLIRSTLDAMAQCQQEAKQQEERMQSRLQTFEAQIEDQQQIILQIGHLQALMHSVEACQTMVDEAKKDVLSQ